MRSRMGYLYHQQIVQRNRIQIALADRTVESQENRAVDMEGVYFLEPKKEPALLHIRVVQCLQSSETLTIDLRV